ncbi:uncharacterized protein LOC108144958 isoform X2 [Drosophila elegans]|uniref:uncharacterized protein LOC108144958 isoform X2 n=1 Tax=Drosophila elegans TaxID=30023 RepID=UPI001BC84155|nr:uncharacterized protein LOC108144958 isoform X2 [Drosophila elegans]
MCLLSLVYMENCLEVIKMCRCPSHQNSCFLVAGLAIMTALIDLGYKYYQLATLKLNVWIVASAVNWILVIIAAVILIVGAKKKNISLLLIWVISSIVLGVSQVLIKIVIFLCFFYDNVPPMSRIVRSSFLIFDILLFSLFAYYPYAYIHELKEQDEQNQ